MSKPELDAAVETVIGAFDTGVLEPEPVAVSRVIAEFEEVAVLYTVPAIPVPTAIVVLYLAYGTVLNVCPGATGVLVAKGEELAEILSVKTAEAMVVTTLVVPAGHVEHGRTTVAVCPSGAALADTEAVGAMVVVTLLVPPRQVEQGRTTIAV